jgi:hypothetical protein
MTILTTKYQTIHILLVYHTTHILFLSPIEFTPSVFTTSGYDNSDYSNTLLLRIRCPRRQTQYVQSLAESPEATTRVSGTTPQSWWTDDPRATSGEGTEVVELVKREKDQCID